MRIGFTGTRNAITEFQYTKLYEAIKELHETVGIEMAHHGDCVGADATFHDICEELGIPITIHPPVDDKLRAWKKSEHMPEEKTYFARNRAIVEESDQMFGVPYTMVETKGGTWYTINYSKKKEVPVRIIFPSEVDK